MTIQEKLKIIIKISGLTQEKLAARLSVTFATLNRWMHNKAAPRQKAQIKIDALYKELSGEKQIPRTELEAKKALILQRRKIHKNILKKIMDNPDIRDQFYLSLTYHSNRIEGSTLSEHETAIILFQNTTLQNKSVVEHLEAKNHQASLEYLFEHIIQKKIIDEAFILKLHSILTNAILKNAGNYRMHGVRIVGANVPTANYLKIHILMKALVRDIQKKERDIITHITRMHSEFEKIHPFTDGNGRVGRLLIHAMALRANLPPAVILQEKKHLYMTYLNKAQTQGDISLLEDFICDAIEKGYNTVERE